MSFIIGFFVGTGGVIAVFRLIAFASAMVVLSIGIWSSATQALELEQISH